MKLSVKITTTALTLGALTALAGTAGAVTADGAAGMTYQQVRAMDDNVSAVEFSIMDTNHDGLVTMDEYDSVDIDVDS